MYVTRSTNGCQGAPVLQIPLPSQPARVPFVYYIPAPPAKHYTGFRAPEVRWTTLRALEPLWFEGAQTAP